MKKIEPVNHRCGESYCRQGDTAKQPSHNHAVNDGRQGNCGGHENSRQEELPKLVSYQLLITYMRLLTASASLLDSFARLALIM